MNSPLPVINEQVSHKYRKHTLSKTICMALLFIALLAFFAAKWYIATCGDVGFDSVMFTLLSNIDGAQSDMIFGFIIKALLPTLITFCGISFILFFFPEKWKIEFKIKKTKINFLPVKHICSVIISLLLSLILLITGATKANLTEYIYALYQNSTFIEDNYVDPLSVNLEFPEEKRNLVYIFLESIETTFLSKDEGGALEYNIIPELHNLAKNNINFSHNDMVGGFLTPVGTTWTVAAMTAHSSGVPLKAPASFERNTYGRDSFLPGINTLTDVLKQNGYYQALMVGSASEFANRDVYYKDHGIDKIYDLYTARQDGIVPEDYHVWWGMEDMHLFDYAKQELTEIAAKDHPFAFTMLTVDTHFTNGYVCSLCNNKHDEQYENVISCSSRQVSKFINWLKKQDFYKNTTVIICGDHLTMDSEYLSRNTESGYEQHVYNCFINSAAEGNNYKNRIFTSLDLFPTTLAAMGVKIPGERLGLGTNLFSNKKTFAEEMGFDEFNKQLSMTSEYYISKFMFE